jgi:hypothetical protein
MMATMNRRNFFKLASAVLAAKVLPVRALSAVAPEIVALEPRVDYLDINKWRKVEWGAAPFWYGLPYWMERPSHLADTYGGISRQRLP